MVSFTAANTGVSGQGFINRFGGVTAQLARWEVTSLAGAGLNIGSMEMRFLGTAPGSAAISGTIACNGATSFAPAYDWANAANAGMSDIVFYSQIPEPAAPALFSLATLALTFRRRL